MKPLLLIFGWSLFPVAIFGAENLRIGPPQAAIQPTVISATASLKLGWNETVKPFELTVANDESNALKIYGVQTTAGLYVADFPASIPAKGEATFAFIYATSPGKAAGGDLVRILTDRLEKIIEIKQEREAAVQFGTAKLEWQQDEFLTPKSFTFTVATGTTTPKAVTLVGAPGTASLESLGGGTYQVTVAPLTTAKPQQFIAALTFSPALPGVQTFVSCAVVGKN